MRYREVCIGGPKHGHRLTRAESAHVSDYGAIRFPTPRKPFIIAGLEDAQPPGMGFNADTYYKTFLNEHRGVPIHFYVHESLAMGSQAVEAMIDFLLYPLEAED